MVSPTPEESSRLSSGVSTICSMLEETLSQNPTGAKAESHGPHMLWTNSELDELKKKAPRASNSVHDNRNCDGPCKDMKPVQELHLIGLCEHAICEKCLDTAPFIDAKLGGSGCTNQKCFLADVAALCPDPDRRHRKFQRIPGLPMLKSGKQIPEYLKTALPIETTRVDSSSRSCGLTGCPSELDGDFNCARRVLVHVYIHERSVDSTTAISLYKSVGLYSDVSLVNVWKIILDNRFPLKKMKKRVFFERNERISLSDWIEVKKDKWKQPLQFFLDAGETVTFVLDCVLLIVVNIYVRECACDSTMNLRLFQSLELCPENTLKNACERFLKEYDSFNLKEMEQFWFIAKSPLHAMDKVEKVQWKLPIHSFMGSSGTVNLVLDCTK